MTNPIHETFQSLEVFAEMHGKASRLDPELWYQTARELTKRQAHETAAVAYTIAADLMRDSEIPDIEKIARWEKAASRELLNAESGF